MSFARFSIHKVIRAYYYNSSVFKMSDTEEGVMEMTEFIFQEPGLTAVWTIEIGS